MATLRIRGFVNAHSHAFQRALRGRRGGFDFWTWRDSMIALAESLTLDEIRREYRLVYEEMLTAGYTAVGEFHYLGPGEARRAASAAQEAGIAFVCLYAAYLRGGSPRFRQDSVAAYLRELEALRADGIAVGVAPHSVRACPAPALRELGLYAQEHDLPLHVHADEQPREVQECLAEHGLRPIELLAREGCLTERTTVVHATHADGRELDLLRDAGARICACPSTEASLADGFLAVARVRHRGIPICIGSDSNVRIDPLEELRELEWIGRRQTGRRGVIEVEELLEAGAREGAAALGLDEWRDAVVDLDHPSLRGAEGEGVYDALVFGCAADVLRKTSDQ